MKLKRPLPPAVLLSFLVSMATLHFALPGPRVVAFPFTLVGFVPLLVGVILNLAADTALKREATTVKPFEESAALVTHGPFSVTRHPMYLGMVLGLLGVALIMGTLTPLLLVPLFAIVVQLGFIRVEEEMLNARFGETWQTYKARVRPWISPALIRQSPAARFLGIGVQGAACPLAKGLRLRPLPVAVDNG